MSFCTCVRGDSFFDADSVCSCVSLEVGFNAARYHLRKVTSVHTHTRARKHTHACTHTHTGTHLGGILIKIA